MILSFCAYLSKERAIEGIYENYAFSSLKSYYNTKYYIYLLSWEHTPSCNIEFSFTLPSYLLWTPLQKF